GTRPEAIKMAPVIRSLRSSNHIDAVVCSTSQHGKMLQQVFDLFAIKPDIDLAVMEPNQQLNMLFSNVVREVDRMLDTVEPDWVLVHGDTTTAAASAIAAFNKSIRIGHVEAGLRTWNMAQPWPEEMNRTVIDSFADHCYAPTLISKENLQRQGIVSDRIFVTGNTVIDAFNDMSDIIDKDEKLSSDLAARFSYLTEKPHVVLVTGHRRENFGDGIRNMCHALKRIAERGDTMIIYPVHLNPNVKIPVERILKNDPSIKLIEPLDYASFVYLMKQASVILTDSGGIQEEASSLGKPILVMRSVTERPEAVEAGIVKLVGTDPDNIVRFVKAYLQKVKTPNPPVSNPYGDGTAAEKIISALINAT
ncbi:MAG: UDP-N-acetylglucosamine 2-epimerase (non-hydrolyzing), partial [Pseudomonadota bacterium]